MTDYNDTLIAALAIGACGAFMLALFMLRGVRNRAIEAEKENRRLKKLLQKRYNHAIK